MRSFFVQWGIFNTQVPQVVAKTFRELYQHLILEGEVKKSTKVQFFSFNRTDVFMYDITVSDNDVLEARYRSR